MLLYYPQYCIASVAVTVILLIMYGLKRNFYTPQNRIFHVMLIDNLLASAINLLSLYSISFPDRYPAWFNYVINAVYLLVYNLMGVLFMLYIDSMTKIPRMKKPVRTTATVITAYLVIMLLTSCSTHLVIYFDENLVYSHGPLMFTLYVTAFVSVCSALFLFIKRKNNFNSYQTFAITGFIFGVFIGVVYQYFHPEMVISNFVCSLFLIFINTAFENPAYYLYGDTPCFNRSAFVKTIHRYMKKDVSYSVYVLRMENFENVMQVYGMSEGEALSMRAAERISRSFGGEAYCTGLNCFAVTDSKGRGRGDIISGLKKCFDQPLVINVGGRITKYKAVPQIAVISIDGERVEGYEMEAVVRGLDGEYSEDGNPVDDISSRLATVRRERTLVRKIDQALKDRNFMVYYQPIYYVKKGRFCCAEALIRLKDAKEGFISPEEFIPVAEKSGRISEIGDFVFREVCRFIKESGVTELGVDFIEINLSPLQCAEKYLADKFIRIMDIAGVAPHSINLEITETAELGMQGMPAMEELLGTLHKRGVTFSIDDFGSGFAAINYLIDLPVDVVKIDKSILWRAMGDDVSLGILKDTIHMIKRMGRSIVVEGVETEEMAGMLTENGCDYMQGYLYSRPVSGEDYIAFLKEKENGSARTYEMHAGQ